MRIYVNVNRWATTKDGVFGAIRLTRQAPSDNLHSVHHDAMNLCCETAPALGQLTIPWSGI